MDLNTIDLNNIDLYVLEKIDINMITNIWKYIIFGLIFAGIVVVLAGLYANYGNVVANCNNGNLENCARAKNQYDMRNINRSYTLLFTGIFAIIIGAYIANSSSNENYKTAGRSLVFGGLALLTWFVLFDDAIMTNFFRQLIFSFAMGITLAFVFFALLETNMF